MKRKSLFLGILGIACILGLALISTRKPEAKKANAFPEGCQTFSGAVRQGDNFATILAGYGVSPPSIVEAQKSFCYMIDLKRLIPGDQYELAVSSTGVLHRLIYHPDKMTSCIVVRGAENCYRCMMQKKRTRWVEEVVTGQVDENIYKDLLDQGHSENFVANLVSELGDNIFAWRIDFFSEQRVGDRFAVFLEREVLSGENEPLANIRVMAALYEGRGTKSKKNYALRFIPRDRKRVEFFDEKGDASKGLFMRAPFSQRAFRISSHFSRLRYHPIHRIWRPHHGTDYAAPVGTPVVAIGSGKVVRAGWNGGYGNCVDIRHNGKYMSRYGHLSKIGVKVGQKVGQGKYIGKSGATGVATGPHLHFEMHVYGKQRNFLSMKFPSVKAVAKADQSAFEKVKGLYVGKLDAAIASVGNKSQMASAKEK